MIYNSYQQIQQFFIQFLYTSISDNNVIHSVSLGGELVAMNY